MLMHLLVDKYDRRYNYLRLSLNDYCSYRCLYCQPDGSKANSAAGDYLKLHEIENLVTAFVELGIKKVRLTGGEPTLRADIESVVKALSGLHGLDTVALTTNGATLYRQLPHLLSAGLSELNISIDALGQSNYKKITGQDNFEALIKGLELALSAELKSLKLNVVLLKGINDSDIVSFLELAKKHSVTVRFIELMRSRGKQEFFNSNFFDTASFRFSLEQSGWIKADNNPTDGPAEEYVNPDYRGRIGFIVTSHQQSCARCNRIRVDCRGNLKTCLYGEDKTGLRSYLCDTADREQLKELIVASLKDKSFSGADEHCVSDLMQLPVMIGG